MAHILVVDDDGDLCVLLKTALERDGHQVSACRDGRRVDEAACRWADCILLDVMMPGEDGFALCRRIRDLADCPILFLTAKTQEADVLTGLGVGGDDYLTKPFRIAELRARVAAHLRRQQRAPTAFCAGADWISICASGRCCGRGSPCGSPKASMPSASIWPCIRGRPFPKSSFMRPPLGSTAPRMPPP